MRGNQQIVVTGQQTEDKFCYNSVVLTERELSNLISKGIWLIQFLSAKKQLKKGKFKRVYLYVWLSIKLNFTFEKSTFNFLLFVYTCHCTVKMACKLFQTAKLDFFLFALRLMSPHHGVILWWYRALGTFRTQFLALWRPGKPRSHFE